MSATNLIRTSVSCLIAAAVLLCNTAAGQEKVTARKVAYPDSLGKSVLVRSALLRLQALPTDWRQHPLTPALLFAAKHHQHIADNVHDFTCILAKRERINGRLRDYEYLRTKVRRARVEDGETTVPFSVYTEFLGPAKLRGRKVVYVQGENDNKMVVRNGGRRFRFVTVRISPDSDAAKRESRYPITELGLSNVVTRLVEQARDDIVADPAGKNTTVNFFRGAKIDNRSCTHIRVTHPEQSDAFDFHIANVYVDDELRVPIRVEGYGWPKTPDDEPLLLEEYTYMRLKLNVGLGDEDFSLDLLGE